MNKNEFEFILKEGEGLKTEFKERISDIENIGSGLSRMKDLCRKVKAPIFKLDVDEKYFRLIFSKSEEYIQLSETTSQKTREKTREKIISLIVENPIITTTEMSQKLKISNKGVEWNLKALKDEGVIKRIGPD